MIERRARRRTHAVELRVVAPSGGGDSSRWQV
jgi:hypothetical protein